MSEEVQIDADGRLRCWKCGSVNLSTGRSGGGMIGKAAIGAVLVGPVGLIGAAAARKKLRCAGCGSVNKPTDSPRQWAPRAEAPVRTPAEQDAARDIARQAFLRSHTPGEVAISDAQDELRALVELKPTGFKEAREIEKRKAELRKAIRQARGTIKAEKKAGNTAPAAGPDASDAAPETTPVVPDVGVDPALPIEPVEVVVDPATAVQPEPVAPVPQPAAPVPPPPTLPPAGWHADPRGAPGLLRYWDGAQWTEHTAPIPPPPGM